MNQELLLIERQTNWEVCRDQSRVRAVLVGLFALAWLFLYSGCAARPNAVAEPEPLPPVHAQMESGIYHLPGCEMYGKLVDRVRLELPTAQEAELSGYRIGRCPEGVRDARIEIERQRFGVMQATVATQERKDRLALHRKLRSVAGSLDDKVGKNE